MVVLGDGKEVKHQKLSYIRFSGEVFRIYEESLKENIFSRMEYSPAEYIKIDEKDRILLYEFLPIVVERYDPGEKETNNITREWFDNKNRT